MNATHTLTDRYLHALQRHVPGDQRAAVTAEVRERIADAIDAAVADGADLEQAERDVLTGLGDPQRLAAEYLDRPLHLIGPRYYLTWWRLLKVLLAIVLPSVAGATVLAMAIQGEPLDAIIWTAVSTTLTVGASLAFWITLVFAVLERVAERRAAAGARLDEFVEPWGLDRLPLIEDSETRMSRIGAILAVIFNAIVIAFLIGQQFNPFLTGSAGRPVPLLRPELWSWYLPLLIVLLALSTVVAVAVYLQGRYSWWSATAQAIINLAFLIPSMWLWSTGTLVNPVVLQLIPGWPDSDWVRITGVLTGILLVGIVLWDIIEEYRRAWRASRRRAVGAGVGVGGPA